MSRQQAIDQITHHFDTGDFMRDLARRVAIKTESQIPESHPYLRSYLTDEIGPAFQAMGYSIEILDNPAGVAAPFLVARRIEGDDLPTVLSYGHGDVIRGLEPQWQPGLSPWTLTQVGNRFYGRGTADNKGQHSINMAALRTVLQTRGKLGFNSIFMIDTCEEIGSPGLHDFAHLHRDLLEADILIGSDGPRLAPDAPTLFMGTRGALNFDLVLEMRAGGHHSGNWGGLLANPGVILCHAIASIIGADGHVHAREILPEAIPDSVRRALTDVVVDPGSDGPEINQWWGEHGLTTAEKVFGWNTFEVLAMSTGNPERPVNAVPPRAKAHCQIRFTVDKDPQTFLPALQRFLDAKGFGMVKVVGPSHEIMNATRLDPDHPAVQWAKQSITQTLGRKPSVVPNLGGSLPNDVFTDIIGVPTIWVPHSYASCSQHAPNEHVLDYIIREGLQMMTGLFWDMGERPPALQ